jgi:hypothetical protein
MYPSAFADCAGIIEKNDNWTPVEWLIFLQEVANPAAPAAYTQITDVNGQDLTTAAVTIYFAGMSAHQDGTGWLNVYVPTLPQKVTATQFFISGGIFYYRFLVSGTTYDFRTPPTPNVVALGSAVLLGFPDFAGRPWDNPV